MQLQTHVPPLEYPLACSPLALALLSYGYVPVAFFELDCCGIYRLALPIAGGMVGLRKCPECGCIKEGTFIAFGFTRRPVPFSETIARHIDFAKYMRAKRMAYRSSLVLRHPEHAERVGVR